MLLATSCSCCLLLATFYLPLATCHLLLTTCYLLLATCYCTRYYSLLATNCLLLVACCLLLPDYNLLLILRSKYDPKATNMMRASNLPTFIRQLDPPIGLKGAPMRWAVRFCLNLGLTPDDGQVSFEQLLNALVTHNYRTQLQDRVPVLAEELVRTGASSESRRSPTYSPRRLALNLYPRARGCCYRRWVDEADETSDAGLC